MLNGYLFQIINVNFTSHQLLWQEIVVCKGILFQIIVVFDSLQSPLIIC